MKQVLLLHASQLVTCSGFSAKRGAEMKDIGVIEDGAVYCEDGIIREVGQSPDLLAKYPNAYQIDCTGKAVLPGFVDSHTHFVFGGYRPEEFSWRLGGDSYMSIMLRGGGINATLKPTRAASREELLQSGRRRLRNMLAYGITTVEGKSGYGMDLETEIRQLEVMKQLDKEQPVDIVTTYLGAHSVPEEYKGRTDDYVDFMIDQVLPVVAQKKLADFCDVFCEENVFSVEQSRKLLLEAKKLGMALKLHADEIVPIGGTELAAQLGATSADHLLHASDRGIEMMAQAGVVATLLPATAFCLKETYARARKMIDSGCAVALASDLNPGSCFTGSIPLLFALATIYMSMSIEEAITAMTINGAAAVGRAHEIGSIDPGKKADMVILGYPSYHFLHYHTAENIVERVVKEGEVVLENPFC